MKLPRLFMVLPAYNEEANLKALLANLERTFAVLSRAGYERAYVIVDDGSEDGTAAILEERRRDLPITVIRHQPNQGLGPTIRDGLRRASELSNGDDIVFSMDADNTHPAGLMIPMTQSIQEGNDVVIASRYQPGARVVGLTAWRRFMSFGARVLFQFLFPIHGVRDYTCGYRAYRSRVLKEAFARYGDRFIEHQGFQCMPDILLKLSRLQITFNELPMILRYDLKGGATKMRVGVTVLQTLQLLLTRRIEYR